MANVEDKRTTTVKEELCNFPSEGQILWEETETVRVRPKRWMDTQTHATVNTTPLKNLGTRLSDVFGSCARVYRRKGSS
ncbi:hypothetical protein RUM44_007733 [Polyplax serrata]|uniref:Uncharacterized protein n=1 Tax=Polyplax serrata TaxID=468196 RepID=A0ABR1BB76_POLSC